MKNKKILFDILVEFAEAVNKHNKEKKDPNHPQFFEEDVEYDLFHFIKWLRVEVENDKIKKETKSDSAS